MSCTYLQAILNTGVTYRCGYILYIQTYHKPIAYTLTYTSIIQIRKTIRPVAYTAIFYVGGVHKKIKKIYTLYINTSKYYIV